MSDNQNTSKEVALFVTCLVDMMRPSVGWASVKLLQDAGYKVAVPETQTCCGQPAYNSGDRQTTIDIAKSVISAFEGYSYVVAPSGSCAGMISKHYVELFEKDEVWSAKARDLARRTYELTAFLADVAQNFKLNTKLDATLTYHDSCSSQRELNVKHQPRQLLSQIDGLELIEMEDTDVCCGFGGTFCVKYPDISNKMVGKKLNRVEETNAEILAAGDLGCLMNIAGKAKRDGSKVKVRHIAEILAGDTNTPAIGEGS